MKRIYLLLTAFVLMATNCFAASISGKVVYEGKVPKLREIKMGADPVCALHHSEKVLPKTIVLNENNEMKNVFLRIVSGLPNKTWPTPTEPVVLDQKGCMYDPPVFGAMIGQPVKILNPDGTLHNVHALSKINPEFNLAMPKFRKETTKVFEKPEFMFQIKCDVHPWMVTYAAIMEHPFFTVTNENGEFTIDNLPPGEYVIEAWQQRLAPQRVQVNLASDGDQQVVDFTFSRPDKK